MESTLNLVKSCKTIWAIGRNYADHARELGNSIPQTPMIFTKSPGAITVDRQLRLPTWSQQIHHEIEVYVQLGENGAPENAGLALDLTARDIQTEVKEKGWPWTLAKNFKDSCPLSPAIKFLGMDWFQELSFNLAVGNEVRQKGQTKNMIFTLPAIIDYLHKHFPLMPGDIILTGTPDGVAQLNSGDRLKAQLEHQLEWELEIL